MVLLLCSCHSRRKEIARIVEEWKNKEVIFPDPLLVKVQGRDTILPDFQERKYKILNYIDTSGCTECRMKLAEWQLLKQEIDSLGYDVDILFVAWVHNYDELEILQRANRCQLPFLYDPQGDMQKSTSFLPNRLSKLSCSIRSTGSCLSVVRSKTIKSGPSTNVPSPPLLFKLRDSGTNLLSQYRLSIRFTCQA